MANDPGKRASLTRIANELGVSAKTVSNAFNRPDQLSADLRVRILETARRLGYAGPDPLARAFRMGRSDTVGVIYENGLSYAFDDPAAVTFLGGLAEVVEPVGMGLTLIPGSAAGYGEPGRIATSMIDGVVAYSLASDDPALANVRDRQLPLVTVDQPRLSGVPWVGIDDERAAAEVAEHLVSLGHRTVGIVSLGMNLAADRGLHELGRLPPITLEVSARRMAGYAHVLLARPGAGPVPVVHMADSTETEGAQGARILLQNAPDVTALICLSDRLAVGAYDALRERGRAIPDDVAIVGFDDIALARHLVPPLTTVSQPHREKGRLAGRALISLLDGDPAPVGDPLPATLVVRASTAAHCAGASWS